MLLFFIIELQLAVTKDYYYKTALTYANQRGHKNIVKILKDAGAK